MATTKEIATRLREQKHGLFAECEHINQVLEHPIMGASQEKSMMTTMVMMTYNTLLEQIAQLLEQEEEQP